MWQLTNLNSANEKNWTFGFWLPLTPFLATHHVCWLSSLYLGPNVAWQSVVHDSNCFLSNWRGWIEKRSGLPVLRPCQTRVTTSFGKYILYSTFITSRSAHSPSHRSAHDKFIPNHHGQPLFPVQTLYISANIGGGRNQLSSSGRQADWKYRYTLTATNQEFESTFRTGTLIYLCSKYTGTYCFYYILQVGSI